MSIDNMLGDGELAPGSGEDMFAPVVARNVPVVKQARERKAYLVQPLSSSLDTGARPGQFYLEGPTETDEEGNQKPLPGYAVDKLEAYVRDWKLTRSFMQQNKNICWSPDANVGKPSPIGKDAPYNIPEGQACGTCRWRTKATAPDVAQNGFCSLVRNLQLIAPDAQGQNALMWMSLRNTAGAAGDKVISMFPAHTVNGLVKPFKVRFTAKKGEGKGRYFIPEVELVK
jgi:hypothetical protein